MSQLTGIALNRVRKELTMLFKDPPPGISAWAREEDAREIDAGAPREALLTCAPCPHPSARALASIDPTALPSAPPPQ